MDRIVGDYCGDMLWIRLRARIATFPSSLHFLGHENMATEVMYLSRSTGMSLAWSVAT